jgi:hypothetical protein
LRVGEWYMCGVPMGSSSIYWRDIENESRRSCCAIIQR